MDFKSVLDFFEGSIFSEEFIGDFAEIRQRLQFLELQAVKDPGNPEHNAWVKFLQSVFCMLTGNLTKAFNFLREIPLIEDLPPKWLLRTATYDAFYTSLRLYPSVIRFRPFLGGPTAALRTVELGFREKCNEFVQTLRRYRDTDLPLFGFESQVLMLMLTASLPLWNDAFIQHPSYARGPWEYRKALAVQEMSERSKIFRANRDQAIHLGIYQLDKYLSRLQVELEYGKSPNRSQMVEGVKNRFRTFVDKHNLAIIKMIEADHILSPPFTNPIALNLLLIEGSQPGDSIGPWDSVEDRLKLGDIEAAGLLYGQAYDLFTDSASKRGCAAVLLRQGCVEHLRAVTDDVSPEEKIQRCETARKKFAESLRLFEEDEAHSQIVHGHQILLSITSGEDSNIVKEAAEIGNWGRAASNEIISQFVGILMQRFGRRQMLDYGRNDVALKCYRCAQSCFTSLGDQFGLFRALSSELYLLSLMNDALATRGMIDKPKEVFKELLVYLEKMASEHPSSKSDCATLRRDMTMVFGNLVTSAYHGVGDGEGLEQWKKELQKLHSGKGETDNLVERSAATYLNKYLFRGSGDNSPPILRRPDFSVRKETSRTGLSSILLRLSRLILGDQEPSGSQLSFSDYVREGQECIDKYVEANSQWRDALQQLDIDSAYRYMREYVSEAAPDNIVSHPENLFPIFGAAVMGEFETSRAILKNILNPKFLDFEVNYKPPAEGRLLQTSEDRLQESFELDNVLAACALSQGLGTWLPGSWKG